MSTHASAAYRQFSDDSFPSAAIRPDHPSHQIGEWVFGAGRTITPRRTAGAAGEPSNAFSEWRFGDLPLTREVRCAGRPEPWRQPPPHARRQGSITVLRADDEQAPSMLIVSRQFNLVAAALPWPQHQSGRDFEVLTLFLPIDVFEDWGPEADSDARCIDTKSGAGALLAQFIRRLAGQLGHIPDDRAGPLALATLALVVACAGPACTDTAAATGRVTSVGVERARLTVRRHMSSPGFGPPQLARLLAMSRSKLYRLLDREGGVAHFINRERLAEARRALATPGEAVSVQAVASQVGFRDHSTFSRAFRREYGCSPTEARERALLVSPSASARTKLSSVPHAGERASIRAGRQRASEATNGEWDEQPSFGILG